MITKKDYENIAKIIGHYNLNEDFVEALIKYFENNNKLFNRAKFKNFISKTREEILNEFDKRDDKSKIEHELNKLRVCRCGKQYRGFPALSRRDNKTEICSDCGVLEAMEDFIDYTEEHKKKEVKNGNVKKA